VASSAAKRYAQAVFSLGKERGTLDAWQQDLALLSRVVTDSRIAAYLNNPSVTHDKKAAAIDSALDNTVQPETHNLVKLLIEHDRMTLIPEIQELFDEEVRAERGEAIAEVTTAEPLTDAEQALVRDKLESMTGKQIDLKMKIDPDIIGGIIIQIGDQVIDGSVRNKLERMRSRLLAGQR
jgi:F-type H+-transporting ATPase subunit delta